MSKKKHCIVGDKNVQSLYRELNGTISADRLSVVLDEIEKLPQFNKSGSELPRHKWRSFIETPNYSSDIKRL